jgi:hypothetical protein
MALNSIHFLLSYACTYECDHCFLYSSSSAKGTFTVGALDRALGQISLCPEIDSVCFEGGEPFLYYPVLLYGVRKAKEMGLKIDIVTNCFWALDVDTGVFALEPFAELGIESITVSDDEFHCAENKPGEPSKEDSLASSARIAAQKLGIAEGTITIDKPAIESPPDYEHTPGEEIVGGGVRFRGRAVEKLVEGLPGKPAGRYDECPDEDLADPKRLHLDAYGNLHICQGVVIGNINETPLRELMLNYAPEKHPILHPLQAGGPFQLGLVAGIVESPDEGSFVDACHLCYLARKELRAKYPDLLGPAGVYGEEWD